MIACNRRRKMGKFSVKTEIKNKQKFPNANVIQLEKAKATVIACVSKHITRHIKYHMHVPF